VKPAIGLALLLLTACTPVVVKEPGETGPAVYRAPPATGSDWWFQGRIAVREGDEGWHASIYWWMRSDAYELKLGGPLGQGSVQLKGDARGVRLQSTDGQEASASDPETLLAETTGWQLPVSGMRYWVRGLPVPGIDGRMRRDAVGRPQHLQQSGWDITYDRFQRVGGKDWPDRLRLQQGAVSVRLVVDQWLPAVPQGSPAGQAP